MPQKLNSISLFSPGNCPHELLESILVGRQDLLDRLEKSVLDSIQTDAGHHYLLVGPRGTGKTHLLAILFNRINKNQDIRDRVVIAYMKEEERGVASFLDWQVRILKAFARRDESAGQLEGEMHLKDELVQLTKMPLEQAQKKAEHLLLKFVGDRRLLLIVENLREIFSDKKGMKRDGQQKFRDLIQQHPFWTIMSSTQALFEDIQTRQGPFYGFFKIQHLDLFSFEQALELLEKLATMENRDQLKAFFQSPAGQGRIRAIHEITGGNPRLLVIFYQFIDRESIEDLSKPFMEMVDNLTAYYQEQMQPLPALQQKIVEFLCERRVPITVKEIAQSCFISSQSAATQLKRLSEQRYVQSTPKGRESYYELREPLFRICFEVKENMGYPISLFIDFLGKFYSVEELKRKYKSTNLLRSLYQAQSESSQVQKLNTEITYIEQAVFKYHAKQFKTLKAEYLENTLPTLDEISMTIDDLMSQDDFREATRLADAAYSYKSDDMSFLYQSAIGNRELGDAENALQKLNELIQADPKNMDAWFEKASIEEDNDDLDTAEVSYRNALELDETNVRALIGIGHIFQKKKDNTMAYKFFYRATQAAPQNARAWLHLGITQADIDDINNARKSFERVTNLDPQNANFWLIRGSFEGVHGSYNTAIQCCQKVVQIQPNNAKGWRILGLAQEQTNSINSARKSYQRATELDPNDTEAWLLRGNFEGKQDEHKTALECFKKITQIQPNNAEGWKSLGVAQEQIDNFKSARKSYKKAIELDPQNVNFWTYYGKFEGNQGAHKTALECFHKVTQIQPKNPEGWLLLGLAQEQSMNTNEARVSFQKATKLDPDNIGAWIQRGKFEWRQESNIIALECFQKLLQIQPNNAEGWKLLGLLQEEVKDIENAHKSFQKATELDPEDAEIWILRGLTGWDRVTDQITLECFQKATLIAPRNIDGWLFLGAIQEQTNDIDSARNSFQKATELAPNDVDAWIGRSNLEYDQESYEMALSFLERAESLSKPSLDLYDSLGTTLLKMNRFDEAISYYHKAIELDLNACFPYFNLTLALFQAEKFEAGMQQISQALDTGKNLDWAEPITICINEINDHLLKQAPLHQLPRLIEQQQQLFEQSPFLESFIQGLTGVFSGLLQQHQDIPLERLIHLNESIIPELSQNDQFRVVCRLFDTGVRYLETEDIRILLELPLEERSKLQELLDLEI